MKQTIQIQIPFSGFYETIHDGEFDGWLESETDYILDQNKYLEGKDSEVFDALSDNTDWKEVRQQYADQYVYNFFEMIKDYCDIEVSTSKVVIHSPREYNFTSDKLETQISMEEWLKLYEKVDKNNLRILVKEALTPRSGFHPYYSNNLEDWGCPTGWETPQIELALQTLIEEIDEDYDETICYNVNVFELINEVTEWDKVSKALGVKL